MVIEFLKNPDEEKNLRSIQKKKKKKNITYRRSVIRIKLNFLLDKNTVQKTVEHYLYHQPRILYPAKTYFKNERK